MPYYLVAQLNRQHIQNLRLLLLLGTSTTWFKQKTNTVFVILDSFSSASVTYDGNDSDDSKSDIEKRALCRVNKAIPANINLSTGIQSLGSGHCLDWVLQKLIRALPDILSKTFRLILAKVNVQVAAHGKCKNTPIGAIANSQGCWSYNNVDLGFDSAKITPAFEPLFENAIATLKGTQAQLFSLKTILIAQILKPVTWIFQSAGF